MAEKRVEKVRKYVEDLAKGGIGHEIDHLVLASLQITDFRRGLVRCKLAVSSRVSDGDGNWHAGAIMTLLDAVGSAAAYTSGDGGAYVIADVNISFYSTAQIQDEIELEAKVAGSRGRLTSALTQARKMSNGEIIALGRLWMAPLKANVSKNHSPLSKL